MRRPERIAPYLASWIGKRRWSGLGGATPRKVVLLDSFIAGRRPASVALGTIVEAVIREGKAERRERFFIPLFVTRRSAVDEADERGMMLITCKDDKAYFVEGERTPLYIGCILSSFNEDKIIKTSSNNKIIPKLMANLGLQPLPARLKVTTLGREDTTNVVVKISLERSPGLVVKTYKRVTEANPEPELLEALSKTGFTHIPKLYGQVAYSVTNKEPMVLSVVEDFVQNDGDGARPFIDRLSSDLTEVRRICSNPSFPPKTLDQYIEQKLSENTILKGATSHLGTMIAELHHALASTPAKGFEPETISTGDVERWIGRAGDNLESCLDELTSILKRDKLPPAAGRAVQLLLDQVVDVKAGIMNEVAKLEATVGMTKIRTHQDLHLAQMLSIRTETGYDFILIDFEGDPQRRGADRREKEPPERDLGTMARSFGYTMYFALTRALEELPYEEAIAAAAYANAARRRPMPPLKIDELRPGVLDCMVEYAAMWESVAEETMIDGYLERSLTLGGSYLLKHGRLDRDLLSSLIQPWRVEKAILELRYELSHRPQNVLIPLEGLLSCVEKRPTKNSQTKYRFS